MKSYNNRYSLSLYFKKSLKTHFLKNLIFNDNDISLKNNKTITINKINF